MKLTHATEQNLSKSKPNSRRGREIRKTINCQKQTKAWRTRHMKQMHGKCRKQKKIAGKSAEIRNKSSDLIPRASEKTTKARKTPKDVCLDRRCNNEFTPEQISFYDCLVFGWDTSCMKSWDQLCAQVF